MIQQRIAAEHDDHLRHTQYGFGAHRSGNPIDPRKNPEKSLQSSQRHEGALKDPLKSPYRALKEPQAETWQASESRFLLRARLGPAWHRDDFQEQTWVPRPSKTP